jgi:hypothetical protein
MRGRWEERLLSQVVSPPRTKEYPLVPGDPGLKVLLLSRVETPPGTKGRRQ